MKPRGILVIDNPFRSWLCKRAGFLIAAYQKLGLTPNGITVSSFIIAVAASANCAIGFDHFAILLWWLSRLLDGTDGIYARASNKASPFGAYLDIVCDMASYSLMILAFFFRFPGLNLMWGATLVLYVLCITSALALGSLQAELKLPPKDNRGLRLGAGLIEGGETGIAYTLFLLFPANVTLLSCIWIVLLLSTVGFRTALAYRILRVVS